MASEVETTRRVYALWGVPPEIQAYAMARYSRSALSMRESIEELSAQRAESFLNTFYFQYGHRSIADLAHIPLAIENISILAAMHLADEPVWDGQERSTRYQNFAKTRYYVPDSVEKAGVADLYRAAADRLFAQYRALSQGLTDVLKKVTPRPAELDERQYDRTIRARAFDVARYLLPLATRTSVGQVVSARVLERQIVRLMSSPLPETRAIAADLRTAGQRPAEAPLLQRLAEQISTAQRAEFAAVFDVAAAPTLVKYTAPSAYLETVYRNIAEVAAPNLEDLDPPDQSMSVQLAEPIDLETELLATLLYRIDPFQHSYRQITERCQHLSQTARARLIGEAVAGRGAHDELLREHRVGYPLTFDILMDVGAFRDLHRHRRCVQIWREPRAANGWNDLGEVFRQGLGVDGAEEAQRTGWIQRVDETIAAACDAAEQLQQAVGNESVYLLPLAVRCRALFKMDLAEAAYIIELRTGPAGHFSYRRAAWGMYDELRTSYPSLAAGIRATDPSHVVDLLQR